MKTYSNFIIEAAGSGFATMSDADFEQWVKDNPAAAEKARQVRAKFKQTYNQAQQAGGQKPPATQNPPTPNQSGALRRLGRGAMGALNVGFTGYDIYTGTKERQAKGEPLATALPKASAEVGGGVAGMTAAATAASKVLPKNPWINIPGTAIAGVLGYAGGQSAASSIIKKIEDPFGGKEKMAKIDQARKAQFDQARQRQAMQTSRQQASKANVYGATKGSGIVGTGKPTTFDQKANTITTSGKTVQLPKTQILPGGRVGDLAYRGGKATYLARASVASRDTNVLSRLSRATGIGGQRERDIAAANRERQQAMQNTMRYRQQLGITGTGVSKKPK